MGASRAAVSGGGVVTLGWDGKGAEELVGWRPWSSTRPTMVAMTAVACARTSKDGEAEGGQVRASGRLGMELGECLSAPHIERDTGACVGHGGRLTHA
jgi:hypothetical protein